jgi:hypothetical protein
MNAKMSTEGNEVVGDEEGDGEEGDMGNLGLVNLGMINPPGNRRLRTGRIRRQKNRVLAPEKR